MRMLRVVIITVALLGCAAPRRMSAPADDAAVRAAMASFMDALNALDADRMERHFTDDITAFVPTAQATRVNGRAAVSRIFRTFVDRTASRTARLDLVPEELEVSVAGTFALATFSVRDSAPPVTRRRTFVFRKSGDRWLISHFHASDVAPAAAAAATDAHTASDVTRPFAAQPATAPPMAAESATTARGPRWYRGSTHAHTLNSDGDSPPADVVRWYQQHGYNFVVITDHEHLTDVAPLNAAYGRPGHFLVMQGQEVTQRVADSTHREGRRQAHVNGIGVSRVVMPLGERALAQGTSVAATYARNLAEIRAAGGLPQVNHPNWRWSVRLQDMSSLPDSTLFEVWNAHPGVNNFGGDDGTGRIALSTEALWDTLLTRGKLLYGVASDDAHHFLPKRLEDPESTGPGGGWVMVRADTLTPTAVIAALRAGNFYSSTGVVLEDYAVTAREIRLRISLSSATDDRRFRTQFIGRGGRILAEVTGTSPHYVIRGNERYVRATVWDSNGRRAWTQPHWVRPR